MQRRHSLKDAGTRLKRTSCSQGNTRTSLGRPAQKLTRENTRIVSIGVPWVRVRRHQRMRAAGGGKCSLSGGFGHEPERRLSSPALELKLPWNQVGTVNHLPPLAQSFETVTSSSSSAEDPAHAPLPSLSHSIESTRTARVPNPEALTSGAIGSRSRVSVGARRPLEEAASSGEP